MSDWKMFWAVVTLCLLGVWALNSKASDKKEFGELMGVVGINAVRRFETPSVQCFTYATSISCVANR